MFKHKKVLLIENTFTHYLLMRELLQGAYLFPDGNSLINQSFITDVLAFVISEGNNDIGNNIDWQIKHKFKSAPDLVILDWGLQDLVGDTSGLYFKENYIDKYYPDTITVSISQHIDFFKKEKNHFLIPKYEEGEEPEMIKKTILKHLNKILPYDSL